MEIALLILDQSSIFRIENTRLCLLKPLKMSSARFVLPMKITTGSLGNSEMNFKLYNAC